MSKIQINSEMFKQELGRNEDAILVVTVEDLFRAWKKKQGPVSKHISCIPAHSHVSKNPESNGDKSM
jgi:peroxiredoxin